MILFLRLLFSHLENGANSCLSSLTVKIRHRRVIIPGDPVTKTLCSQCRGPGVQSLVRELRSYMPQLKTLHSQINKLINKNRLKKNKAYV